ncbi:hypothetical protein HPB48_013894 [Haemaphysalis longicornis]|uniref:Uncharacterized protein n=1 Tax=Haemaphysalis longicornis TaxID=44386 RepID=A0A9J6G5C5_HAELO|nr:hypothetical protein HPB48_013894 [Haemaphysalis longicornis]
MTFLDTAIGDIVDLTNGSVRTRFEPPEYGEKLNRTVASASLRSTINYLGFYVVDHLWIYSPEDVAQTITRGQRERNCLRMAERAAPSQTAEIGYHAYKNLLNFTELHGLTAETKQRVVHGIRSLPWMDDAMKLRVVNRVRKIAVELFPRSLLSVVSVAGLARSFRLEHSSALDLYQRTVELRFTSDIRNSLTNNGTQLYRSLFSRHIQLDRKGVLHVPIALVKPSVGGDNGALDPTPYVALLRGTSLRMRLAKALLKAALGHSDDGGRKSLWTHKARRHFRVLEGCFRARFPVGLDQGTGMPNPPSTLTDEILEYVAVTLVHLDFRRGIQLLTNNATSDYRLADAQGWSSDQLFFVSYAQSLCHDSDKELASRGSCPAMKAQQDGA